MSFIPLSIDFLFSAPTNSFVLVVLVNVTDTDLTITHCLFLFLQDRTGGPDNTVSQGLVTTFGGDITAQITSTEHDFREYFPMVT